MVVIPSNRKHTCSTFSNKRHLKVATKVSEQKSLYPNNSAMLVQMFTANGVVSQKISAVSLISWKRLKLLGAPFIGGSA